MVPACWMWVGKVRGYEKQLREYHKNILEMCHCHGACFLDVGGKISGCGRQLSYYLEHMLEMCQCHGAFFLNVGEKFSWVQEKIEKICRKYAGNVGACFWMWVGKIRGYGTQSREYLKDMREMYQCHGAYFLDVWVNFLSTRNHDKNISKIKWK
jgi:uncharacterized protein (DUF1330 family)